MSTEFINQVLELTNAERTKAGLSPLKLNFQLLDAAQDHSDDMANDDFFSHTGVDGSNVGNRVRDTGYQYSTVGENIAAGQTSAAEVVRGWMNSPGHRANILNSNFTEIGIGYEFLANDTGSVNYNHYWTQVFGTPLNNNGSRGSNSKLPTQETFKPTPVEDTNNSQEPISFKPTPVEDTNNSQESIPTKAPQFINQVLELTNAERSQAGLSPLKLNSQLLDAAQDHSDDMAKDDFFSHTGVDGSTVGDRVRDAGYQYLTAGENIAAGQTSAAEVVRGWMNSPGHRANILNSNFTEIGIGYEFLANDTGSVNYKHYWTQVFGTPLNNNGSTGSKPIDNSDSDFTGQSENSLLTGGDDALDFVNGRRGRRHRLFNDIGRDRFSDLLSDSGLGNGTDINQNYEVVEVFEEVSISNLGGIQQDIFSESFDSFI